MKLLDNFLTMLNLNDDDDYDDDDYFEEEEEEYEKPAPVRRSTPKKAKEKEREIIEERPVKAAPVKSSSKVTPIRQTKRTGGINSMPELRVIKPASFDDARDITDTLLSGRAVVLNLEGLDIELAHRIMDFTFGSCYAINGNLRKVSNYILVITPPGVDISGDFQELFAGSIDVPSFVDEF